MKHKVVYNDCYGGYALSDKAINWLEEHGSERTKKFIETRKHTVFRPWDEKKETKSFLKKFCN